MKNGCEHWKDCDTCPFDDCMAGESIDKKTKKKKKYDPEYYRNYYQKNKEKIRAYQKEYRKKHPEMQKNSNKKWKENNREHVNKLQRDYIARKKVRENGKEVQG